MDDYFFIKLLYACDTLEDTSGAIGYASSIDLLSSGTYPFVTLPTVTSTCYTASYELVRLSDDTSMTSLFPSLFSQTSTEFTLAYDDPSVFSDRKDLFDSGADFYVKRTLTGTVNSMYRFRKF